MRYEIVEYASNKEHYSACFGETKHEFFISYQGNYYFEVRRVEGKPEILAYAPIKQILISAVQKANGIPKIDNGGRDFLQKVRLCLSENHPFYEELALNIDKSLEENNAPVFTSI